MAELRIAGRTTLIDDADLERMAIIPGWTVAKCGGDKEYVRTQYDDQYGIIRTLYLHRWLTLWPLVDHINGNGLDNRRCNLRPATREQNAQNTRLSSVSTSGYKGVNFYKRTGRWRAHIKQIHLGYFATAEEAARAYDTAALYHYGEYANLNFPLETAA